MGQLCLSISISAFGFHFGFHLGLHLAPEEVATAEHSGEWRPLAKAAQMDCCWRRVFSPFGRKMFPRERKTFCLSAASRHREAEGKKCTRDERFSSTFGPIFANFFQFLPIFGHFCPLLAPRGKNNTRDSWRSMLVQSKWNQTIGRDQVGQRAARGEKTEHSPSSLLTFVSANMAADHNPRPCGPNNGRLMEKVFCFPHDLSFSSSASLHLRASHISASLPKRRPNLRKGAHFL